MNKNNGELGNLKLFRELYGEGAVTEVSNEQFLNLKPRTLEGRIRVQKQTEELQNALDKQKGKE